jgi:hypothetical protein
MTNAPWPGGIENQFAHLLNVGLNLRPVVGIWHQLQVCLQVLDRRGKIT